ncbi:MAG TPA: hypothetical protein VH988_09995 [Thermoanaerobaculia bacterium]|nr:hypothetical protein [Thermoanaerobaculia bacterium]
MFSRQVVAAVRRHPVWGGLAFAVVGALMILDSIESGRRFRRFENALQASATVTSVVEASSVPPRWDVALSWPEHGVGARGVVRVGSARAHVLHAGDAVDVLVSTAEGRAVILAADRPRDRPLRLGIVEATPLFFVGVALIVCGLVFALAGRLRRL